MSSDLQLAVVMGACLLLALVSEIRCITQLTPLKFKMVTGTKLISTSTATFPVGSGMQCGALCAAAVNGSCHSYSLHDDTCSLFTYDDPYLFLLPDLSYKSFFGSKEPLPLKASLDGLFGDWLQPLMCPNGYYVYGFATWHDDYDISLNTDDCGITGVELHCRSVEGSTQTVYYNNMDLGANIKRATVTCSDNGPVNAYKFQINNEMGFSYDDEGMNDLRFYCRDSEEELVSHGPVSTDSVWSSTTTCPDGMVICGVRFLEEEQHELDNSCINELLALCCLL